jgi:serine/threonine-protein kinase RsbT
VVETLKTETLPIRSESDVVVVRKVVRLWATDLGFGLVDLTKTVTAASELARNTVIYGGGGDLILASLQDGRRKGLRMIFADQGPGIADLALAMTDGYTSGGGLGMGLSGSKRLMSEFDVQSKPGEGTRVTIVKWK